MHKEEEEEEEEVVEAEAEEATRFKAKGLREKDLTRERNG
jgi:hypothetical protein